MNSREELHEWVCGDWNLYHTDFNSIDQDLHELKELFA